MVLVNIVNTMSDPAATEIKWHKMLEAYRATVVPDMTANWSLLSDLGGKSLLKLHTYVQVAEVSAAAFLALEPENNKKTRV